MERIIDHFNIDTSPRMFIAAIDRMATKNNYSVYGEMDGLRILMPFSQVRLKNEEKQFELQARYSVPKLWLLFPFITVCAGVMTQEIVWGIVSIIAAVIGFKYIKKISARRGEAEVDAFREKLLEVVNEQRGMHHV